MVWVLVVGVHHHVVSRLVRHLLVPIGSPVTRLFLSRWVHLSSVRVLWYEVDCRHLRRHLRHRRCLHPRRCPSRRMDFVLHGLHRRRQMCHRLHRRPPVLYGRPLHWFRRVRLDQMVSCLLP